MAPSRGKRPKGAVFVEDFVEMPCPLGEIRGRFLDGEEWLAPLANAAEEDGETLRMQIGPSWLGGRMTREVRARVLGVRERQDAIVVSISWHAARHPALFPVLEGDLELAPIGGGLCRLTLSASYVPPLGELGHSLDTALLRRVGQSTVRSFVQRLATSITETRLVDRRLEPLVEYRLESRTGETTPLPRLPYLLHLAHPSDERALCGHERSQFDSVGPYIWDVQFHCSGCWSALE